MSDSSATWLYFRHRHRPVQDLLHWPVPVSFPMEAISHNANTRANERDSAEREAHLFTDNVIQVGNADISFDQRNFIHLLWEGSLLDVVPDPHIVVGCWAALGDKHLLWKETHGKKAGNRDVISAKQTGDTPARNISDAGCLDAAVYSVISPSD